MSWCFFFSSSSTKITPSRGGLLFISQIMKKSPRKIQIGVIGSAGKEEYKDGGGASKIMLEKAEELGALLAQKGVIVVTGGKGGIMEAASRGAKKYEGLTVGIVKGTTRFASHTFVDVEVITGMAAGGLDELLLVLMCDAIIVVGGGAGTLQEITIAYRNRKPVVALTDTGGWTQKLAGQYLDERNTIKIKSAPTPRTAVSKALKLAKKYVRAR